MDGRSEPLNLDDDEIVKSTQFMPESRNVSQHPTAAEFVYASSQVGAFNQPLYVPPAAMRPPQINHSQENIGPSMSQLPYGPQNMWPAYGPSYASAMHPMHHLLGNGMYSPFPSGNYNGIPPTYGGGHAVPTEAFLLSQAGHVGGVQKTYDWQNLHKNVPYVRGLCQRAMDSGHMLEPHCQTMPESGSASGPWIGPRPPSTNNDQQGSRRREEVNITNRARGPQDNRSTGKEISGSDVPFQERQSPPADSEETSQGPVLSASINIKSCEKSREDPVERSQSTAPSKCNVVLQQGIDKTSKSIPPDFYKKRKAQREDDKSYLKEVKVAISEGRVPQVTVLQDENGNIVRYRSQFMNAVKLAAHAVVQDAYIDVNDEDTMNEIMKEVKRQFVLKKALPLGMVEEYLKSYFKRCRSKYHKFWHKHGDMKRPDGCKQAAWLQLVEYWKSPEGSKECNQNKVNASAEKLKSKEKHDSDQKELPEAVDMKQVEERVVPVKPLEDSDPLGFDSYLPRPPMTPLTPALPSVTVKRNPMADISNQLHNAVDSILSSYEASCGLFPSSSVKRGEDREPLGPLRSQSVNTKKGSVRTVAEVLNSMQRPRIVQNNETVGPNVANGEGHSCIPGQVMYTSNIPTQEACRREFPETFGPKGSAKDSSGRGKMLFKEAYGKDMQTTDKEGGVQCQNGFVKEEVLELSSDGSSEEVECTFFRTPKGGSLEESEKKPVQAFTEELEERPCHVPKRGLALGKTVKEPIAKNEEANVGHHLSPPPISQSNQKKVMEDKKLAEIRGCENSKVNLSDCKKRSRQADIQTDFEVQRKSEEYKAEGNDLTEDFESASDEEPPVLPRKIPQRKAGSKNGESSVGKEVKGKVVRKNNGAGTKKLKDSMIDSSVLKKLEFYKRPKNANPIKNRVKVWILHPKLVGKVVAEGFAGINRKSRCVDSANEICKEGQQMISVVRVLYKNTPVMFDAGSRFPKDISYLDQVEGLPNTPILWCISHIIEIPPIDQITRLLGESMQLSTQEEVNSDSDFEGSRSKRDRTSPTVFINESRNARKTKLASSTTPSMKNPRTVHRSGDA